MVPPEIKELRQLALLGEMGRPLAHECNNFLNNLSLQMAIMERDLPAHLRPDWNTIRREGQRIASLFQEWQRFRKISDVSAPKTELHEVFKQFANELARGAVTILPGADVPFSGSTTELKLLCLLLLQLAETDRSSGSLAGFEVEIVKSAEKILIELRPVGLPQTESVWADFDHAASMGPGESPLGVAACKSFSERLKGKLFVKKSADRPSALVIELPLSGS